MKTLLRPYEGTLPYLFVSYAHKNDAAVLEIISTLQSRGFRVWYDEGIEAGSEWPESIASHLERAQLVLAFLSPAYLRSDNCRKEMHYALTKRKPVINVYLEPTELSPGMEMQIGNLFALMKYTYPSEEYFYDKLFSAELLDAGKFAGEPPELPVSTTPSSKIGDFFHRPLHRGGIGSAPVVRGKSDKYLPHANLPQNGKRPCRNGQTGRDVSIGEMELEKGIIMLLGGEIACFVSGRRGSCAVTKIPACYLTVPII